MYTFIVPNVSQKRNAHPPVPPQVKTDSSSPLAQSSPFLEPYVKPIDILWISYWVSNFQKIVKMFICMWFDTS